MNILNEEQLSRDEQKNLQQLIVYLQDKYLFELDLKNLKGIKIVSDNYLHPDSDGRFEDNIVLLPYSKTKRALSNNYDNNYESLKSTIYHELIHCDFRSKYPILHNLYDELIENGEYNKAAPIQIWVEFNVERKNNEIYNKNTAEGYIDSIINYKWNFNNEDHFMTLKKHLPYIIVRINGKYLNRQNCLERLKNECLKRIIIEVEKILYNLSNKNYEDNYNFLKELCDYLDKEQLRYT